MLNELLQIDSSLQSYGLQVNDITKKSWHTSLQTIPGGGKNAKALHFTCFISGNSSIKLDAREDVEELRYYVESNQASALSFKHDVSKTEKKAVPALSRHIQCNCKLNDSLGDNEELKAFAILSSRLKNIDVSSFLSELNEKIRSHEKFSSSKACYILLDIDDWRQLKCPNPVQSFNTFDAINQILNDSSETSESKDFFGNDSSGFEKKSFKIKLPQLGYLTVYSKNEENGCYSRYNVNGNYACKIGDETRKNIQTILEGIVSERFLCSNRNNEFNRGLWYSYPHNSGKLLVITTLAPDSDWLEGQKINQLEIGEWLELSKNFISNLQGIIDSSRDHNGIILMVYLPSNGACQIKYFAHHNTKQILEFAKRWESGINTCPHVSLGKFIPPTIKSFFQTINKNWKSSSGVFEEIKNEHKYVSLSEVYDFFFDSMKAIKKITHIISKNHIKMMINSKIYDRNLLFPIAGIALHKNGYDKEKIMDSVPFAIGRLASIANEIHRKYFSHRGMSVPQELVGHRLVNRSLIDCKAALAKFQLEFRKYLEKAEKWIRDSQTKEYFPIREYYEIMNNLTDMMKNELEQNIFPKFDKDIFSILMAMGCTYSYRKENVVVNEKENENV